MRRDTYAALLQREYWYEHRLHSVESQRRMLLVLTDRFYIVHEC